MRTGRGRRDDGRGPVRAGNRHWRLEFPIGKVLFESPNWISHPKISPDGKWVAFADHQNAVGDDEGSVAVVGSDGKDKEKILSTGWTEVQGILWSPTSDEIWFTSTHGDSGATPRAVTLSAQREPSRMCREECSSKMCGTVWC